MYIFFATFPKDDNYPGDFWVGSEGDNSTVCVCVWDFCFLDECLLSSQASYRVGKHAEGEGVHNGIERLGRKLEVFHVHLLQPDQATHTQSFTPRSSLSFFNTRRSTNDKAWTILDASLLFFLLLLKKSKTMMNTTKPGPFWTPLYFYFYYCCWKKARQMKCDVEPRPSVTSEVMP